MQRQIELARLERNQTGELDPARADAGGADHQHALVVEDDAHVVQDDAVVADLDDAALHGDLGPHVAQAKVDGAEIEPTAHLGLQQRPAHPRAHVRLALGVGHRVGRDEREQAGADVTVDVGLDVLGHEPRPQRGAAAEAHRRPVDRDRQVLHGDAALIERELARPDHHVAIEVPGAEADGVGDRHLPPQVRLVQRAARLQLDAQAAVELLDRAGGAQERLHQLQVEVPGEIARRSPCRRGGRPRPDRRRRS